MKKLINYLLGMIEKKASIEELTLTLLILRVIAEECPSYYIGEVVDALMKEENNAE